jgi:hypothetical protein
MSRVRHNPESPDSVRARLAIIATERQAEFQTVLAEFAAERFLYRLGISDLEREHPIGEKGFTKAGVRKMIAKINEELAAFEGREEARLAASRT